MINLKSFIFETPSKSLLVGIGFPEIIASIFIEKFNKKAFLIARWFKEYNRGKDNENWWEYEFKGFSYGKMDIYGLVKAYEALKRSSFEEYHKIRMDYGLEKRGYNPESYENQDIEKYKSLYREEIKNELMKNSFFYKSLIKGIINGTIKDLKPY